VATGSPPESEWPRPLRRADELADTHARDVADAADRVLRIPLVAAGFTFEPDGGWRWSDAFSFVGIAVRVVPQVRSGHTAGRGGVAFTFGWRYDAFGDPQPSPTSAEGCLRQLSIDDIGSESGPRLSGLPQRDSVSIWEQRLSTTFRKHVVGRLETWKRPDGFRDFLADRRLHLSAAWLSAALGHRERVDLELRAAAELARVPLEAGFDRRRADRDEAFAAPLAARHGLGSFLTMADESGDRASLDSFGGRRDAVARDRVTEPELEHARLLRRREVYAALCLDYLEANAGAR